MKNNFVILMLILFTTTFFAQVEKVSVAKDDSGMRLLVNGKPFMINGMNWDYVPIGTDVTNAEFYKKSDNIIKAGLDAEMALLQNMGVNAIRQYTGVPPKWVKYIYETYGVYTVLNDTFGRYGLTIDGVWNPVTDYSDPKTQKILLNVLKKLVEDYKDTPGILMYLLGNENNYGLFWAGAETEDFPEGEERMNAVGENRGRPMYKLMNDAAKIMKGIDSNRPVAMCNGDILFIDIIAEECPDIDIYGTNTYRGVSFGDIFKVVKEKLNKPILFTEFGSDAFNEIEKAEDQKMQAYYMVNNWKEIYENAAGLGKANNSLGGFTFQFSDGWWKLGFDDRKNSGVHDNDATWAGGGYTLDLASGKNNMNEEWFGICAKGPTNPRGLYTLYPRAAYYALKEAHQFNPYIEGANLDLVDTHFSKINLMDAVLRARGDKAASGSNEKLRISNFQAKMTTFSTGGFLNTTPEVPDPDAQVSPDRQGFDHMQSYFIGVEGKPTTNMTANVNFNILGNVAGNPIDEVFYENLGNVITVNSDNGNIPIIDNNRLRVYNASFEWKADDFDLRGFYRTGHSHWGYEGDFFGLYPDANYGPNLDIYNGEISGIEVDGKGKFKGLKAAFGPQLWWGANPAVLLKYRTNIGHYTVSGVYHKDLISGNGFDEDGNRVLDPVQVRTGVIPALPTERLALSVEKKGAMFGFNLGAIWAGRPLNGSSFQDVNDAGVVVKDKIEARDNWGGKAKVTFTKGTFNWYAQASLMGLVANGGVDNTLTFTGWKLKDGGSGNKANFFTGIALNSGKYQIAPNFMYQKPLVDPMQNLIGTPARLRNFINDPFAVRDGSRETAAAEILFTFDPTPGSYMYSWDNDRVEDSEFAMNFGFVFRHLPTTQDAAIGFLANRSFFPFAASAPAEDLWEVHSKIISKLNRNVGIIGNLFYGNGQANGEDTRLIKRFGGDVRMIYNHTKLNFQAKFNDWGPFDYHRDFNLTFPVQLMLDVSTTIGKPDWFILPTTQVGIRGTWRSLDQYSPRYSPNIPETAFSSQPRLSPVGFPNGSEWEIRTYIHINIGK